jgi:Fe-S cluster biogenesis protein NfuA
MHQALNEVRLAMQANGDDLEVIEIKGNTARVAFHCSLEGNESSLLMLKLGIERKLKDEVPGFGQLIAEIAGQTLLPTFEQ